MNLLCASYLSGKDNFDRFYNSHICGRALTSLLRTISEVKLYIFMPPAQKFEYLQYFLNIDWRYIKQFLSQGVEPTFATCFVTLLGLHT